MYLGWIGAIVCIAGYVLFLNGWNPVVSVAMMFVGSIVAYDMSRRAIKIISTNQDEE
jgi:membrane protein implicated in regulation of membrane protease activity